MSEVAEVERRGPPSARAQPARAQPAWAQPAWASSGWASPAWASPVTLVLSLVGVAIAGYLTWDHYTAAPLLACPETGVVNCARVTSSDFAVVLGVPVAVAGLAFFAAMTALSVPSAWRSPRPLWRRGRLAAAALGVLAVPWLVYVELFEVDAICLYCTAVHVVALALFGATAVASALSVE